jgi:hypothetical protein
MIMRQSFRQVIVPAQKEGPGNYFVPGLYRHFQKIIQGSNIFWRENILFLYYYAFNEGSPAGTIFSQAGIHK